MFQVASSGAKLSEKVLHTAEDVFPASEQTGEQSGEQKGEALITDTQPEKVIQKPQTTSVKKPSADLATDSITRPDSSAGRTVSSTDIQKLGHSLLFACLGYFAFMAFYGKVPTSLLSYTLVLFAASTEILQLVIDGRLFGVIDLALDIVGIAAGAVAAWLICHVRRRQSLL